MIANVPDNITDSFGLAQKQTPMTNSKRTLQINVRLSPEHLKVMRQAAERIWPGVPLSNSTLLLTLANHKALEIVSGKSRARKSRD